MQNPPRSFLRISCVGLISAFGMVLCTFTLLGFGGRWSALLDLMSHFRVQYLVGLCLIAAVLCAFRKWRSAAVFGFFATVNLVFIMPYFFGGHGGAVVDGQRFRALLTNVHTANPRSDLVLQLIEKHDPDFIVFEEVSDRWMNQLASLRSRYPYWNEDPRGDNFGIAFASKIRPEESRIVYLGEAEVPSVYAKFRVQGRQWHFLGTHPLPPGNRHGYSLRNEQLLAVARFLKSCDGPVVLLGDLNATPWSPHFRRLVRDTGLRDSALGFGIQATWPTPVDWLPVPSIFLRVPIDHCLVSSEWRVVGRQVGQDIGSDHYPLVVDFVLGK